MKYIRFSRLMMVTAILAMTISSYGQDKVIPYAEVPASIQSYIKMHFNNVTVLQAEIDYEGLTKEYDIVLNDGTKLDFDRKNRIKSIKGKSKLPSSVIPVKIQTYVQGKYPDNHIVKWETERSHQSVELNNGLELEFNKKGNFLRIDN